MVYFYCHTWLTWKKEKTYPLTVSGTMGCQTEYTGKGKKAT